MTNKHTIPPQAPNHILSPQPPKRRKGFKIFIISVAVFVSVVIVGAIGLAVYLTVTPMSPMNLTSSMGTRAGVRISGGDTAAPSASDKWYDSVEESLADSRFNDGRYKFLSEPLATKEDEAQAVEVRFLDQGENRSGITEFIVLQFEKQNGKYSSVPQKTFWAYTNPDKEIKSYVYKSEIERVVHYVDNCLVDNLSDTRKKFPYFGVSQDPNIKDLSILGKHPTGVIDYEYEGTTYYFWYYEGVDYVAYLESRSDFSFGGYTLSQLIEVLDIKTP